MKNNFQNLLDKTYRFLSFRPRSEWEVRRYLQKKTKEGEGEQIEAVVENLKSLDLLDDRRFCLWWRDQRIQFKPRSRLFLKYELKKLGVDEEVINEALTSLKHPNDFDTALSLGAGKLSRLEGLDEAVFQKKMAGILARGGFGWTVIKPAVEKLWEKSRMSRERL